MTMIVFGLYAQSRNGAGKMRETVTLIETLDNCGIDDDDLCINVPRVVLTADGNYCVGVYD